jgi:F-type H+-transporting ATPase subunit gamma
VNEVKNVAHIVCAADRGLCGGYNYQIMRSGEGEIKEQTDQGRGYKLYTVGKKHLDISATVNMQNCTESFTGFSERPTYEDASRILPM